MLLLFCYLFDDLFFEIDESAFYASSLWFRFLICLFWYFLCSEFIPQSNKFFFYQIKLFSIHRCAAWLLFQSLLLFSSVAHWMTVFDGFIKISMILFFSSRNPTLSRASPTSPSQILSTIIFGSFTPHIRRTGSLAWSSQIFWALISKFFRCVFLFFKKMILIFNQLHSSILSDDVLYFLKTSFLFLLTNRPLLYYT